MTYDFTALGEILIDFTPDGSDDRGFPRFLRNPGGAVANAAAVLGKYGAKSALIGKVGNDMFGRYLRQFFTDLGVDCGGMILDEDYNTTLAFVSLDEQGDRDFAFYRRHEADTRLTVGELPAEILTDTRIFHFGSLSLTAEPSRSATYAALDMAKQAGALISYDPNFRDSLWAGQDAVSYMNSVLDKVDFIKVSEEEGEMMTGEADPAGAAEKLLTHGIRLAAVTLGADGAYIACDVFKGYIPPYTAVKTIDTTGAGDTFWGTMMYEYLTHGFGTAELVRRAAERASKAAALCTSKKGAAPSIPDYGEI